MIIINSRKEIAGEKMEAADNGIRDNKKYGSVGDFLKSVVKEGSELSIVSAYFTIFAYYALHEQLDSIKSLKFLFGEPTFVKSFDADSRCYKIEDDSIVISPNEKFSQKQIASKCAEWLRNKAEIKSIVKPNFLHGKMYYVHRQIQDIKEVKAISGSSNFTTSGLGLKKEANNIELNLIVDSDRQKEELKGWFDTIWNDNTGLVQDVKEQVLKYLEQLYKENEPELIYFKTLYSIFSDYLDEQINNKLFDETAFKDTEIWNRLYDFQKDGVKGAINKLIKHNGCIIADSVGLGKTFEALAVIKYFELKNYRVLVLCPKKLSDNWTVYQASKNSKLNILARDRFQYNVLYHTDLGRDGFSKADQINLSTFNWGTYDLVVIDESHNFKGNPIEQDKNGNKHKNRAKWLMDKIIKSGNKTKVLMLSATPVNNTLKDLRNQINFITEGNQAALFKTTGISDIANTLENAQKQFSYWSDPAKNPERTTKQLLEKLDSSFFKLLDELTIARSRKHIVKFYDESAVGKFPERKKPIPVYSKIDMQDEFPEYAAINEQISNYQLSIFNPSKYIKEDKKGYYAKLADSSVEAFVQEDREKSLIGMMKVGYLKRLESSIHSFAISIDRTVNQITNLLNKIDEYEKLSETEKEKFALQNQIEQDFEDDENFSEDADSSGDFDKADLFVGKKLKFSLADLKLNDWKKDLRADRSAMVLIKNSAKEITADRDAKLQDLKKLIKAKTEKPLNPNNKKVIVFTAFADTAEYLYKEIQPWAKKELNLESGLVCGSNSKASWGECVFNMILTNFAPKAKHRDELDMDKSKELDILIATDCISEGQNLQDCDYLINYDIHWNPVRIIQRFGRIDRLGSTNKSIQLVNFWPTQDLDDYIKLKTRVESRMALVDLTATNEDNILENSEAKELISEDLKYRDQQLKRLKNEILDLEDMNDSISLTDFTLDDFRVELSNFLSAKGDKIKNVPDGIYAIVPSPENSIQPSKKEYDETAKGIIRSGVIYCLRQKNKNEESEKINPLNPYFLIYIRDDGTVRFNYTSAKSILEIYRLLCEGEKAPYEELCNLFNTETTNGENMQKYAVLLEKAVAEIITSFKKRVAAKIGTSRSGVLISTDKQASKLSDFELVTWLIIK